MVWNDPPQSINNARGKWPALFHFRFVNGEGVLASLWRRDHTSSDKRDGSPKPLTWPDRWLASTSQVSTPCIGSLSSCRDGAVAFAGNGYAVLGDFAEWKSVGQGTCSSQSWWVRAELY